MQVSQYRRLVALANRAFVSMPRLRRAVAATVTSVMKSTVQPEVIATVTVAPAGIADDQHGQEDDQ